MNVKKEVLVYDYMGQKHFIFVYHQYANIITIFYCWPVLY